MLYTQRTIAANRPILRFIHDDLHTQSVFDHVLINSGTGVAYIKEITYYIDNQEQHISGFEDLLSKLKINYYWVYIFWIRSFPDDEESNKRFVFGPGQKVSFLSIISKHYSFSNKERFKEALSKLYIEILYLDPEDKPYLLKYHF